jgi:hypothetical protein
VTFQGDVDAIDTGDDNTVKHPASNKEQAVIGHYAVFVLASKVFQSVQSLDTLITSEVVKES